MDPRQAVFERRLRPIRRIVAFGGGKGGVGKTTVATLAALNAAEAGNRVGLLDLDLHGGAAHLVLGIEPAFPDEEGGILPLEGSHGLAFMSATAFSANLPLVLRGGEVSDAIAELLAVTIWPELDLLVVDLPPGMGDGLLDMLKYMPRAEIVVVTTASAPAIAVADRFLAAVRNVGTVIGRVFNATFPASGDPAGDPGASRDTPAVPVLADVAWDADLEAAIGDSDALLASAAARALKPLSDMLTR